MPANEIDIIIDAKSGALYRDLYGGQQTTLADLLPWSTGWTLAANIFLVEQDPLGGLRSLAIPTDTTFKMGRTAPPPGIGYATFTFTQSATIPLDELTAQRLQDDLNGLAAMITAGGIDISGGGGDFVGVFRTTGDKAAITVAIDAVPTASATYDVIQAGSGSAREKISIRIVEDTCAATTSWSAISGSAVTVTVQQTGSASLREIEIVELDGHPSGGSFTFSKTTATGAPISVFATAAEFEALLTGISVEKIGQFRWRLTWDALGAQSAGTGTAAGVEEFAGISGTIALTSSQLYAVLGGQQSEMVAEIADAGGEPYCRETLTVSPSVGDVGPGVASSGATVEGAAVLSTGETGGTKFLREDGDGTSSWQAALSPANNLSDLASAATARTNLGLGTAATTAATAYATAAQGTTADAAMPRAGGVWTGDTTVAVSGGIKTHAGKYLIRSGVTGEAVSIGSDVTSTVTLGGSGDTNLVVNVASGFESVRANILDALVLSVEAAGVDVAGDITLTGTVDGRDVASDGVTADAALPRAGGTMTGPIALPSGSVGTATGALYFAADTDCGLARFGANHLILFATSNAQFKLEFDGANAIFGWSASPQTRVASTGEVYQSVQNAVGANWGVRLGNAANKAYFRAAASQTGNIIEAQHNNGTALFAVNATGFPILPTKTPASATATGTTGEMAWDTSYIYVCTATNTWKRTAIATW